MDYRPVALTSHAIHTLERLILDQLQLLFKATSGSPSVYQACLGDEDVIVYLF